MTELFSAARCYIVTSRHARRDSHDVAAATLFTRDMPLRLIFSPCQRLRFDAATDSDERHWRAAMLSLLRRAISPI